MTINLSTAGVARKLKTFIRLPKTLPLSLPCALSKTTVPQTILDAANGLIQRNTNRLGKDLWSQGDKGEPIKVYAGFNDLDEARFIAERIQQWIEEGGSANEAAILYRSNAQSRVLEEALLRLNIPYQIYGGQRFFERAEVRMLSPTCV